MVIVYIATRGRFNKIGLLVYSALIVFLLLNAFASISNLDILEFFKSFLLTAIFLFVYISTFNDHSRFQLKINYSQVLKVVTYIIFSYGAMQIAEGYFLQSHSSWFFLDNVSISTATEHGRFEAVNFLGYTRPVSLYYEPSFFALTALFILVVNDNTSSIRVVRVLSILSILISFSTTILIFLILYYAIEMIKNLNNKKSILFLILSLIFISIYFVDVISLIRLNELSRPGTSGYIRIIEPLLIAQSELSNSPFGIPLGQLDVVFNNSAFLIVAYFGLLTFPLFLGWIYALRRKLRYIDTLRYMVICMAALFTSGAIFTVEFAVLFMLLNTSFFSGKLI